MQLPCEVLDLITNKLLFLLHVSVILAAEVPKIMCPKKDMWCCLLGSSRLKGFSLFQLILELKMNKSESLWRFDRSKDRIAANISLMSEWFLSFRAEAV